MTRRSPKLFTLAAAISLFAAACGSDTDTEAAATETTAETTAPAAEEPTTTLAEMVLPDYADGMTIALSSDSADGVLTANTLEFAVAPTGYEFACGAAGRPLAEGQGHYHVLLDGSLVDMKCTPTASVSMQNLAPGTHELVVVPALNDHAEIMPNAQAISFDYQPTDPLPEITDADVAGDPAIKIISPKPGDVVSGTFEVVVETTNFTLSEDLLGKPGIIGYGHWHANLDSLSGPMGAMTTMMGMSGTDTFEVSTEGLTPGDTHNVIATLVDNGHAPFPTMITDQVEITIG